MPYIKKIELRGFKSFGPQAVKITLDEGFSAITGPNGSGKTNILDAFLFALGELSTKRLRAETASKLIFHGSEKAGLERAKIAKVIIQFDNSDGRLAVDTTTVTISREVYRNGQSVYRLNGRRISRTHILEVLSMAGISSSSHNVVLQGTITKLTEISPLERRKIIEDLVGIGQYDAEKNEAEGKLQAADISIRTAMGRIDEVQNRLDDLERERNELLRASSLRDEIEKLEAIRTSHDLAETQRKVTETSAEAEKVKTRVEKLKELRDGKRLKRREIEEEWRMLSSEIVEGGGSQVLKVQIRIGELKSKLTELATKVSSGKMSIEGLRRVRENSSSQYESIKKEIRENRSRIKHLRGEKDRISNEISVKQAEHDLIAKEATSLWENLGENSKRIRELELGLESNFKRLSALRSEYSKSQAVIKVRERRLKDLNERKEKFGGTLGDLEKSYSELAKVQKEQKTQLKNLERSLEQRAIQKEAAGREITEAGKIADSAREAVIEFQTQRNLAETVAAEEKALRSIEELGDLGVIPGVYGRLRSLVRFDGRYQQAIEAAATGWLEAVVVKDFDSAFTCTETLRKMKLGRIKIIPLKGASIPKQPEVPNRKGVDGLATAFIKCRKDFETAINFVFGDTLIVADDRTAFSLSSDGYRAVTVNGDLFEAGTFETGFYRAPIDFAAIIPSNQAIKSLDEAVIALQQHLSRRVTDVSSFEEEMGRTRVEIARLRDAIATLERELGRVKKSVRRTRSSFRRVERIMARTSKIIETEKSRMWVHRAEGSAIQKEIRKQQNELATLRSKTDLGNIQEMEVRRERLAEEIITLRQKLGSLHTENATLQSQYDNVLRTGYQNFRIQLGKVDQQDRKVRKDVDVALQEREGLKQELAELEKSRIELSKSVFSAREEAKKFTSEIDGIDKELRGIDAEYEESDRLLSHLQLTIQTSLLKLEQYKSQLGQLGYEQPLQVTQKQLEEAEASIKMMQLELERIGAVNQLALSHYAEQISRYKELSMRMNELEREKQAIVRFMDEIEQKKRRIFMGAFEKISINLRKYFSKLTGGGVAVLKLENPDEPFSGGIDMTVQFPSKPSIVVGGASGGERSVSAVAFLFALKEFTPATFYVLDEVDAHLDAFHVSKLADLLLEESEKTQFIAITLKPEMVNKAQKVYGVYGRNGVSNVVAASFLEVNN